MRVVLSRSVLPSLTRCYIQRACLVRQNHLACSAVVCRAAISTQPVPSQATGQVSTTVTAHFFLHFACLRLIMATLCVLAKIGTTGACSACSADASALLPQVISKEANFVTVRLNERAELAEALPGPIDLLCSVRALLKKIKQTVLVGDNVQVDSIDWADKRGQSALEPVIETYPFCAQSLSSVMLAGILIAGLAITPGIAFACCLGLLHDYVTQTISHVCLPTV